MWETRFKWMLYASFATASFIFLQMAFFSLHVLFDIRLSFNVFKICFELFRVLRTPWVFYTIHLLVIYTFASCLWVIARQMLVSVRSAKRLTQCQDIQLKRLYTAKYGLREHQLIVIRERTPVALTLGVVRPQIVISTGLIEMLDSSELEAVMEHERFHLMQQDPLAIFLLSMLTISMWYIPMFRWVRDTYKIIIEIMADRFAMSMTSSAKDLGSALLKMLKQQGRAPGPNVSYASFAETSINLRILHILEPATPLTLGVPVMRTLVSVLTLLILVTLT